MKNILTVVVFQLIFFAAIGGRIDTISSDSEEIRKISVIIVSAKSAIGEKNYIELRKALVELTPLMKRELKASKKNITRLQKQNKNTDNLHQVYKRKKELLSNFEHLLEISPAALRVNAVKIESSLMEYKSLTKT